MRFYSRVAVLLLAIGSMSSEATAQTLTTFTQAPRTRFYRVFADANIRDVLAKGSDAKTATGQVGISVARPEYLLAAVISVASTADTVRGNYGTALVSPSTGGALNAGLVEVRFPEVFRRGSKLIGGARAYASVSSSTWAADTLALGVTVLGGGLGYTRMLIDSVATNELGITGDIGLAFRSMAGDIATARSRGTRVSLLRTSERFYWGPEVGLSLQVNQIVAGLTYYYFFSGPFKRVDVPGLGQGQVSAGISIKANLISGEGRPFARQ